MTSETTSPTDNKTVADTIAQKVLAHPDVSHLDSGPLGLIATHLPGQRIHGVRFTGVGEPVEISVIVYLGTRIPELTGELRTLVRGIAGDVSVDVTIVDMVERHE